MEVNGVLERLHVAVAVCHPLDFLNLRVQGLGVCVGHPGGCRHRDAVQVLEDHLCNLFHGFLVASQGVPGPAFPGQRRTRVIRKSPQMIRDLASPPIPRGVQTRQPELLKTIQSMALMWTRSVST